MTARTATAAIRPSTLSRIYGFGSVYAKTIRDSRLAFIVAAGLLGGVTLAMGAAVSSVFPTPASRLEIDNLIGGMPPQMVDFFGRPEKLGTLGGYLTWKYGLTMVLIMTVWSVLALSGTLAGEASRGSLDVVATSPFGKRRIALEKVAAHLTMLTLVLAIMVVSLTVTSNTFGDAALGDRIDLLSAVGFALWLGFGALFFGGLAFALAPVLGRAGSAGVAGIAAAVLWTAHTMDMGPIALLSPYRWMGNQIALVGEFDWLGVAMVGVAAAALLVIGVEVFARRDLGVTAGLGLPALPGPVLGVKGPISRAFGDQLPRALAWGIGLGVFGAMLASLVGGMSDQLAGDPTLLSVFETVFPSFDLTSAGSFLQLFVELMYIAAGFAAATFVAKWRSDETDGRLEELLATTLTRARWVIAGALAALGAVAVMTLVFALGIGLGAASGGVSAGDSMLGSVSLGLYAAALVGVGVAVAGLWRTSIAAEIVALIVVATYLIDLLALPLGLPDWVHQLALTAHFGQPMVGHWDLVGVAASLAIAAGGIAIGAWGMRRRDVEP